jgi:hypothetical protein
MVIEIGREHLLGEGIDLFGEAPWDMGVAQMLAHHRAVFGLHQGIVVALAGAGLGELLDHSFSSRAATRWLMYS